MARMAWFKKERKPRTSERIKLEIPADAWEKCDECGHIDIKDRFVRALNVCPNCGHHRRISAQEYIDLLVDEGSWHELDTRLRSTDPLHFENYKQRLGTARNQTDHRPGPAGGLPDRGVSARARHGGRRGAAQRAARHHRPAAAPHGWPATGGGC